MVRIAQLVLDRYGGIVPADVDALCSLPGIGRKTANLVRSFAFHKPAVCVDTHVHGITNRWGLVRTVTPDQTEVELRRRLPHRYWIETNPFLVQHGQQVCLPTGPRCDSYKLAFGCCYRDLAAEQVILSRIGGLPRHPCLLSRGGES